jgi:death on curing protein
VSGAKARAIWYPSAEDVLRLHEELVVLFAGEDNPIFPPGVKDLKLLESACNRPKTSLGDTEKYPTIEQKAAALLHSLVKNHPFHNGNKRTALMTVVTFLWRNDRRLRPDISDDEIFVMVVDVANNEFTVFDSKAEADELLGHLQRPDSVVEQLGWWFKDGTVPHKAKPRAMSVSEFLERCSQAGLRWKESGPSYVVWDRDHSIKFSQSTKKFEPPVVRQFMAKLGLRDMRVEEFQEGVSGEQQEMYRFRHVLRRLASA